MSYICSICSIECELPNSTNYNNPYNLAVIDGDNVMCQPCNEISDWGITKPKIIKKEIIEKKPEKKIIETFINCPKCKKKFSGKVCQCGFKNPLYR